MTVREGDRSIALYHITDRTPQQVAYGLKKFGDEHSKGAWGYALLEDNIRAAENLASYRSRSHLPLGTINGQILSLPHDNGWQDFLSYGIGADYTYLMGGSEGLADITRLSAERIDELANGYEVTPDPQP